MPVLSLINHKGGVGKSSLAFALAHFLSHLLSVLVVDLDPQANLSSAFDVSESHLDAFALLFSDSPPQNCVSTSSQGVDIVLASKELNAADELFSPTSNKVTRLRHRLAPLASTYDYIIIDTPPHLRTLSVSALVASDEVLIPVTPDVFASRGLIAISEAIDLVKSSLNPALSVKGVVVNRFNARSSFHLSMLNIFQELSAALNYPLLPKIRDSVKVSEAISSHLPLFSYAPRSPVASDYESLMNVLFPSGGV